MLRTTSAPSWIITDRRDYSIYRRLGRHCLPLILAAEFALIHQLLAQDPDPFAGHFGRSNAERTGRIEESSVPCCGDWVG